MQYFALFSFGLLTLLFPFISESCIEIKIKLNFYFHTSLWCLKGFMKALKAFIKPFEAPQRSMKIKILTFFFLRPGLGLEGLIRL